MIDDIFINAKSLKAIYDSNLPYESIGVYSYLEKLSFGLQLFMTLTHKFNLSHIDQTDLIPLTTKAEQSLSKCGVNHE